MKKLLSFLFAAVILVSALTFVTNAEQTNMEVDVPMFDGTPVFDGSISYSEWGEPTVVVVTEGAATTEDVEIGYHSELGLQNYFYYYTDEVGYYDSLAYELWFRWDKDYLYVGAVVNDPDPFSLPEGGDMIWNGDCLQIYVDEQGPSAVMKKSNPDFDYTTDSYNGNRFKKPWASRGTFDAVFGLVKGTDSSMWRMNDLTYVNYDLTDDGAKIAIDYITDGESCVTTYEGAIPWSSISDGLVPYTGTVLGSSVAVYCSDSTEINAMLQWGCGVGFVDYQPTHTRGGSQALVLTSSTVEVSQPIVTETTPPETTTIPETVTTEPEDDEPVIIITDDDDDVQTGVVVPDSTEILSDSAKKSSGIGTIIIPILIIIAVILVVVVVLAIPVIIIIVIIVVIVKSVKKKKKKNENDENKEEPAVTEDKTEENDQQ